MPKARTRWLWLLLPLAASINILLGFAQSASLLQDSDTRVLLAHIRETGNPLKWFVGDWPLGNHFYRPISTLFFEVDNAIYHTQAWGYGLTNALICVGCVFLLFWFVREALDDLPLAGLASLAFGLWHTVAPWDMTLVAWACLVGGLLAFTGLRHGKEKLLPVCLAGISALFLGGVYGPVFPLRLVIEWLPGRTASVMVFFCLAALASYARWERLTASRRSLGRAEATDRPLRADGPAPSVGGGKWAFIWLIVAFASCALALGSYEQAIMLPGLLVGVAILYYTRGYAPRWQPHVGFWLLLVGYLVLRHFLVSSSVSGYQAQQFRDGPGVALEIFRYFLPVVNDAQVLSTTIGADPLILITTNFWAPVFSIAGFFALAWIAIKDQHRWWIIGFHLMSGLAFLPMAWFKKFDHYHYWSGSLRAVLMILLLGAVARAFTAAVSPRSRRAPPRRNPAPGSLLHQ